MIHLVGDIDEPRMYLVDDPVDKDGTAGSLEGE
jgi:hypothetical protein